MAAMPTLTAEATMNRLAHVERKVQVKGWSAEVISELCAELGVNRTTVYDDWRRIKGMTRRFVTIDLEKQRREQMAVLDTLIIRAMNAGDFTAAASAMKVKGQISGTITPPGTKVDINLNSYGATHQAAIATIAGRDRALLAEKVDAADALKAAVDASIDASIDAEFEPADVPPR